MEILQNPVALRGLERILIVLAATLFGYLGYKLFHNGITEGKSSLDAKSKFGHLVFSGTAPGLFFMLVAALVLAIAVVKGGAARETTETGRTEVTNSSSDGVVTGNISEKQLVDIATLKEICGSSKTSERIQALFDEIESQASISYRNDMIKGGPELDGPQGPEYAGLRSAYERQEAFIFELKDDLRGLREQLGHERDEREALTAQNLDASRQLDRSAARLLECQSQLDAESAGQE